MTWEKKTCPQAEKGKKDIKTLSVGPRGDSSNNRDGLNNAKNAEAEGSSGGAVQIRIGRVHSIGNLSERRSEVLDNSLDVRER